MEGLETDGPAIGLAPFKLLVEHVEQGHDVAQAAEKRKTGPAVSDKHPTGGKEQLRALIGVGWKLTTVAGRCRT